jgi:hypothetical protein
MKRVIHIFSVFALLLVHHCINSQIDTFDPDSLLVNGDRQTPVLLVGTFHFAYYGYDAHKTDEEDQVDILSAQKQKEIRDLVEYIARFEPTKLVVEGGRNSGYLMHRYRAYKSGEQTLRANEIDQLCFRLMDQFQIDTLYGCDANGIEYDMYNHEDSTVFRPYLDTLFLDYDFESTNVWSQRYSDLYRYEDKLASQLSLLDYFKYTNSEKCIRRGHGAYLLGDFELGEFRGADALALYWYSRNLRIFRNIQRITASNNDRILVLFGAGHLGILQQQFESSPAYRLIPFNSIGQ